MRKQFYVFCVRWLVNSLALWVAVRLLESGDFATSPDSTWTFLLAGLALSVINTILKPVLIVLSLPAIVITLGLFMLIVNGLLVYLAVNIVPGINIDFLGAILAGIVVSLANYIFSGIMDQYKGAQKA